MKPLCSAYFVGERPQVTWAWDLDDRNLRFLCGIDAGYFTHIASTEGALLESEARHFAVAALRVAYGQALETLFALAGAAVQAPGCVVGWMLAYRNDELLHLVRAMASGRPELGEYLGGREDGSPALSPEGRRHNYSGSWHCEKCAGPVLAKHRPAALPQPDWR